MIYLVTYDRVSSTTIAIRGFNDSAEASQEKLRVELDMLKSGEKYEVVVLEAADEMALRRTHGRYFSGNAPIEIGEGYDESLGQSRICFVREAGSHWTVEIDGHRATYPTKESAVGAAAKDAKIWARSSGRDVVVRVVEAAGTWQDIDIP